MAKETMANDVLMPSPEARRYPTTNSSAVRTLRLRTLLGWSPSISAAGQSSGRRPGAVVCPTLRRALTARPRQPAIAVAARA
jgi:hypothetical protein